jgi:SecD/SecF fusion protein
MKDSLLFVKSAVSLIVLISLSLFFSQCKRGGAEEFKSKGGLRVYLTIDEPQLLLMLSGNNHNAAFRKALSTAGIRKSEKYADYADLFVEEYRMQDGEPPLAVIFGTYDLKDKVSPQSTDEEVVSVLKKELSEARKNTMNILCRRIEYYGTVPSIEWLDDKGCILVEIPGVKDPERVINMLENNAAFEFWETYDLPEIYLYLIDAEEILQSVLPFKQEMNISEEKELHDKTTGLILPAEDSEQIELDALMELLAEPDHSISEDEFAKSHPLFSKLAIMSDNNSTLIRGPVIGLVSENDKDDVMRYLEMPEMKSIFPFDLVFKWSEKPLENNTAFYELYALKKTSRAGAILSGDIIKEATVEPGLMENYSISLLMNAEGARTWRRITADNVGRCIAMVVDGTVYSAPIVNSEIIGGRSIISGNFTRKEAADLANILNAGRMPAQVIVTHSEMVPPVK